ncbi:MAG: hypothetical protein IAG10_18285, partial [Planctomycetaceae bacterium]|nr:hypothetical protein [Planctomycetaceae bacterium]
AGYRKGLLHFYHNTVIIQADQDQRFNTRLFELNTNDESVDLRNNVVFVTPSTPGAVPTTLSLMTSFGKATLGTNWLSDGWQISTAYGGFLGTISGINSQLTNLANDPGLVDFAHGDLRPAAISAISDQAVSLHKDVSRLFPVTRQIAAGTTDEARVRRSSKADLGAFESNGTSSLGPLVSPPTLNPNGSFRLDQHSYSVREDAARLTITVWRVGGANGTVAVNYDVSADSAQIGSDFRAASGRLTFRPREIKKTFSIPLVNDSVAETTESFGVRLFDATGGATLADEGAVVWLHDNEAATFQFARSAATVNESSGGLEIDFTRLGDLRATVSVNVTVLSQTAQPNLDFGLPAASITLNPGEAFGRIWVSIADDSDHEPTETFQLQLTTRGDKKSLSALRSVAIEILDEDL